MACRFNGFNDPASAQDLINLVLEEKDERRWRPARMLARMKDAGEREKAEKLLDKLLGDPSQGW